MRCNLDVYLNVGEHNFFGYTPHSPVAHVPDGPWTVEVRDPASAPEAFWPVGNKMEADSAGKPYPYDVRSLSKGDMVRVETTLDKVGADDDDAMDRYNKCADCCLVIGCDTCGPCSTHDDVKRFSYFVCESSGWREVLEPTNPIVQLNGTDHTSRSMEAS